MPTMDDKSPRYRAFVTGFTALGVAGIAVVAAFFPPFPIPAWLVGAFTVAPAEHWWYSLSDAHRAKWIYDVVTTSAEAVYPLVVAIAFWLWTRPLRRGVTIPWRRGLVCATLIGLASSLWFVLGWHWAMRYQGPALVALYILVNVIWLSLTVRGMRWSAVHQSWWGNLGASTSLYLWATIMAFPWLGESI